MLETSKARKKSLEGSILNLTDRTEKTVDCLSPFTSNKTGAELLLSEQVPHSKSRRFSPLRGKSTFQQKSFKVKISVGFKTDIIKWPIRCFWSRKRQNNLCITNAVKVALAVILHLTKKNFQEEGLQKRSDRITSKILLALRKVKVPPELIRRLTRTLEKLNLGWRGLK